MQKLLSILFIFVSLNTSGQVALKGMLLMPAGEFGIVMKKHVTFEAMYMEEFDGKWRSRYGLSYSSLKARLDTFPVYAVLYDNSGTHVLPGYQVYQKCTFAYLFGGYDFRFTERTKLSPYIGFNLLIGGLSLDYDEYYETYKDGSVSGGGGVLGGLGFRIGLQYQVNEKLGIFSEGSTAGYLVTDTGLFAHYDFGIGIHYVFNP